MNYTYVIVNRHTVHICEVGAMNKPGRIVQVLKDVEAMKFIYQLEREIKAEGARP
jgi:hypothetical protein